MLEVARLSTVDRNDLFWEAVARISVRPFIVENDYRIGFTL